MALNAGRLIERAGLASLPAAPVAAALDLPTPSYGQFRPPSRAMVGFGKALAAQLEVQPDWQEVGPKGSSVCHSLLLRPLVALLVLISWQCGTGQCSSTMGSCRPAAGQPPLRRCSTHCRLPHPCTWHASPTSAAAQLMPQHSNYSAATLQHYLDYGALKKAIKACREAAAGAHDRPALARLLDARKAIFQGQLDTQVTSMPAYCQCCNVSSADCTCVHLPPSLSHRLR